MRYETAISHLVVLAQGFHLTFGLVESQHQDYLMRCCGFIPQSWVLLYYTTSTTDNEPYLFNVKVPDDFYLLEMTYLNMHVSRHLRHHLIFFVLQNFDSQNKCGVGKQIN